MHQFFGLTIDEWGSVVAIFGGIGAVFGLIIKSTSIMDKLQSTIETLDSTLKTLVSDNRETKHRLDKLEDRMEEHIGEAKVRNQRITSLEHEIYNRKKE